MNTDHLLTMVTAMEGKRFFITGGSGFIGAALIRKIIERNEVTIYGTGRRAKLLEFMGLAGHKNLRVITGDIMDKPLLQKAFAEQGRIDAVIHLAAVAGVSSYNKQPLDTILVNFMGTYNVLDALKEHDVGTVALISTGEIYGPSAFHVKEDDLTVQGDMSERRWTYAISKLAAENLGYGYFWSYRLPLVFLRAFNIYGPGQTVNSAVSVFIRKALKGEDITIFGDGAQLRSWCHVDDMAEAILQSLDKPKARGQSFNIGAPEATITVRGLAEKIVALAGSGSRILFNRDYQGADISIMVPDVAKSENVLGFSPQVMLDEGLKQTIAWYRKFGDKLPAP